jgi:enamine deaminase RidA (YjgF/YER057c/UK114 family)
MSIKRVETGPRMSQVVVHNGVAYLAGQVSKGATVREQTEGILKLIDRWLASVGTDKSKLLSATVWLTDMADYNEMNAVWDAWVPAGTAPARACVQAKLAFPELKVEIALMCAV